MSFLLANNVPAQHVKDMCAMKILHLLGGVTADLKIYWRDVSRVNFKGATGAIATEPCKANPPRKNCLPIKQHDGRTTTARLWLGFIAVEVAAPFTKQCFQALLEF